MKNILLALFTVALISCGSIEEDGASKRVGGTFAVSKLSNLTSSEQSVLSNLCSILLTKGSLYEGAYRTKRFIFDGERKECADESVESATGIIANYKTNEKVFNALNAFNNKYIIQEVVLADTPMLTQYCERMTKRADDDETNDGDVALRDVSVASNVVGYIEIREMSNKVRLEYYQGVKVNDSEDSYRITDSHLIDVTTRQVGSIPVGAVIDRKMTTVFGCDRGQEDITVTRLVNITN